MWLAVLWGAALQVVSLLMAPLVLFYQQGRGVAAAAVLQLIPELDLQVVPVQYRAVAVVAVVLGLLLVALAALGPMVNLTLLELHDESARYY